MPIPNELFRPRVVSTSAEVQQIAAWVAGQPVPTLEELGEKPTTRGPVPYRVQPITPPSSFIEIRVEPTPDPVFPKPPPRPAMVRNAPKTVAPRKPFVLAPKTISPRRPH